MTTTTTPIDLTPFCGIENNRFCQQKPFFLDGHLCAMDGHVLIRTPSTDDVSIVHDPHITGLMNELARVDTHVWQPWPLGVQATEGDVRCDECRGCGSVGEVECKECDGDGRGECDECGSEIECDACGGEGTTAKVCEKCKGKRDMHGLYCFEVGGRRFAIRYYKLLCDLPNVVYAQHNEHTFFIKFDGGDGAVAPLRI